MATVIKDFKVKSGLVVEGSTATVNNFDVLTKKEADQTYIIGLIGGTATDAATANTVVKRNGSASFSANVITADLVGDVTGQVSDISNFDTNDLDEGTTNLYFSNARSKSAAADLLTSATLTNITITGSGSGLTISAENGVADSDTDDLVEGTSNLYFSNDRAVSALEAVVPKFTAVELNTVAKQIAATLSAPTAGIQVAHSFAKATYRSAEYLVKVAYGSHTEISKVLLTLDTADNIAITEYAIVGTNGSASTISAAINGSDVELRVTTANNTSIVTVVGTLVA
jgi:hypothetical protein